jgi:hypothetical protein
MTAWGSPTQVDAGAALPLGDPLAVMRDAEDPTSKAAAA